jgi:hypothetical protein
VGKGRGSSPEPNDDLPPHIDPGEVVVSHLGGAHPVTHVDERGIHLGELVVGIAPHEIVLGVGQLSLASTGHKGDLASFLDQLCLPEIDPLEKGAVPPGWLEAQQLQLGGDVVGGHQIATRPRFSTLQKVVGKKRHVSLNGLGPDAAHGRFHLPIRGRPCEQNQASGNRERGEKETWTHGWTPLGRWGKRERHIDPERLDGRLHFTLSP